MDIVRIVNGVEFHFDVGNGARTNQLELDLILKEMEEKVEQKIICNTDHEPIRL